MEEYLLTIPLRELVISLVSHDNHALSVECSCEARHESSSCSLRHSLHRVTTPALHTIQGDSSQTDYIHSLWNGEILLNIITGKLLRILKYNSFEILNHFLHRQSTPTHKLPVVQLNSQSSRRNKSHSKIWTEEIIIFFKYHTFKIECHLLHPQSTFNLKFYWGYLLVVVLNI